MSLTLNHEECTALAQALDNYLPQLRRDLVRTDVHSAQHELNVLEDALEAVRARLSTEAESIDPDPEPPGVAYV